MFVKRLFICATKKNYTDKKANFVLTALQLLPCILTSYKKNYATCLIYEGEIKIYRGKCYLFVRKNMPADNDFNQF